MKITYVINAIKRSGPNQVLLNMVTGLSGNNYEIDVVTFFDGDNKEETQRLESLGAKVHVLDVTKREIPTLGAKKLREYLEVYNPDVIHAHGILSDIAVVRSGYGSKAITTIHNDMFEDYIFSFGRVKGMAYIVLHLFYLRAFNQVVCCSKSAWVKLSRYIPKAIFIHNGIAGDYKKGPHARTGVRKQLGIQKDDKVFLYTGKLNARKNVLELLEDFKVSRNEDEHLVLVGNGELEDECKKYEGNGIHLVGFQSNVDPYYQAADVYVSASHAEGFSISVIEATQYDLLLLLSDIPAHKEVFNIDKSMYIGETFSKGMFAASKIKLLGHDQNQAIKYYKRYLTDIVMMKAYDKAYQGVLS